MAATKKDRLLEWVRWGLSALVIPLALWGVKLEVNNAVQNERIAELQTYKTEHDDEHKLVKSKFEALQQDDVLQKERISVLQADLKEAKGMKQAIQANTLTLVELKTKIDGTHKTLEDIKEILRQP